MNTQQKALVAVPIMVFAITSIFGMLGLFFGSVLGLPSRLGVPVFIRGCGVLVLFSGFSLMGWLLKYRTPIEIITSTYESMQKARKRTPQCNAGARTETLVFHGPQRYVRHPMYLAVVLLFAGCWLVLDYTLLLFMASFFLLWFNLVVIQFEEKELKALYGIEYEVYVKTVPRFFPLLGRKWR